MPIYEYRCRQCQKDHEIIQKLSDPLLTICPACGGKLEKRLSLSSFQLKGGGWYKEGYSSSPPPKPEKKPEAPKEAPKSDTLAKPETPKKNEKK